MEKITIPKGAQCWCSNHGNVEHHVSIDDEKAFAKFCLDNNIGYHDGARTDIVKSYLHVFTKNRNVFTNFPPEVNLVNQITITE